MYAKSFVAASALLAVAAAVPMNKRDAVVVTKTAVDVVTVPLTTTVWVAPGATGHFGHGHHPPSSAVSTSSSSSSVYVAPTPSSSSSSSSSSSVYVAPTTSSSSSSSVYVAPTTSSSSVYVAPTTSSSSSTYVAPTTSTSSAAAATSSSSSSSGGGLSSGLAAAGTSYTGDLTYYDTGLGACGWTSTASDHIVAISEKIFDSYEGANPNANPLCGKSVTITGVDGSPYSAKIVDRCTGCAEADLDLSQDFFNTVTSNGDGRVHDIKWKFD